MSTYSRSSNVRKIRSDTWSVDDIIEGQLADERAVLQKKREWLVISIRAVS